MSHSPGHSVATRTLVLLLAALAVLPLSAPQAGAQTPVIAEESEPIRTPVAYRRWLYMLIGAAVVATPAYFVHDELEGLPGRGSCTTPECMATVGGIVGGAVGFMIGYDRDRRAQRRALGGREIALRSVPVDLEFAPTLMALHEAGLAVAGPEGIAMVRADGTVATRRQELRGVTDLAAFPSLDAVLATTPAGLFVYPFAGGEGRLVMREAGNTLTGVGAAQVVLGSSSLLRRLHLSGSGAALQAELEAEETALTGIEDVQYSPFTGVLWVLTADRLLALSPQRLQVVGSVTLPVPGRTLSVTGTRALVAAGTDGALFIDVSAPEQPRLLSHVRGIPFAFRGVIHGERAYIASGRSGLVVLDVTDPARPGVLGTLRNLGAVQDVAVSGAGDVYALSREGRRVHIVQPQQPAGSQD
jgi:hypothetical protein